MTGHVIVVDLGFGDAGKGGIVDWLGANLPTETKEAPKQAPPEPGALKG